MGELFETQVVPGTSGYAVSFGEWTGRRDPSSIGTNAGTTPIPFQRWRNFKEAFTPELVEQAVNEMTGPVHHIVDPFGGSGTTGLAAQFLGLRPTLIEVNPYLADLIHAKLAVYDIEEVRDSYVWLIDRLSGTKQRKTPVFRAAPPTFIEPGIDGRYIFSRVVAGRILDYRDAIGQVSNPAIRRLFRVILGSVVVPVSNVIISGKGRRYRRQWKKRPPDASELDALFRSNAELSIYDLHRYASRRCRDYTLLKGDSRTLLASIEEVDLAVFSPPYPNSFDYTDVYNVELWSLGYLDSPQANSALRNATLRSHVQIARDSGGTEYPSRHLKKAVERLRKLRHKLWNGRIPDMIAGYFSDMGDVLKAVSTKLRDGGRVYMVVGDSRYAGVHIPVATILAEIAPSVGVSLKRSEPCRSMRVSPQQGGQHRLAETLLVFQKS